MQAAAPLPPSSLPRRILIVSDAWGTQINGVVRTYQNIIASLQAQDVTIKVIGPDDFPNFPLPFYPEIRLAIARKTRVARLIEDFAPEAIHIAVEGPLGWAAWRYCRRKGLPFTTAYHTDFAAYIALKMPRPLRGITARLAMALLIRFHNQARNIFVTTRRVTQALRQAGVTAPIQPLSRGVDLSIFHPAPDVTHLPRDPACPRLLYVGRVSQEKNIEAYLDLPLPSQKTVVGDGPALARLRARYPDVRFTGALTGAALGQAYREADLFVFPSRTDTFGIVLIEALASGLAIAAFDEPGPDEVIAGNPDLGAIHSSDLMQAVTAALDSKAHPQSRHEVARLRFSWQEVAADFHRGLAR